MIIEGEDKQIQLGFAEASTIQYDAVLAKTFTTGRGEKIGLAELVTLETRPELSAITRKDQRYSQRINWEYIGTDRMKQADACWGTPRTPMLNHTGELKAAS